MPESPAIGLPFDQEDKPLLDGIVKTTFPVDDGLLAFGPFRSRLQVVAGSSCDDSADHVVVFNFNATTFTITYPASDQKFLGQFLRFGQFF